MLHQETLSSSVLRPTYLNIDLDKIAENYRTITERAGNTKVMFILKANAYGHGLIAIARHLESMKAYYFGVAYLEEGIMLREAGIKTPILVLGGLIGNQIPVFIRHDLTITASSIEKLNQIEKEALKLGTIAKAHLKVDTGMERIGMHYYSAEKLLEASLLCRGIKIEGVFTHLARAAEEDQDYSLLQISRFKKVLEFYKRKKATVPMTHVMNSGGFLQLPNHQFDMVRIGILLYGIFPSDHLREKIILSPALTWKTHVVYFKVVKPDHPVSYGSTWKSDHETRVVTLPVGYGDGYMRAMSNRAEVIIRGKRYPCVGNICMDQTMINIESGTAYNGDEVILIGEQGDEKIGIEDLARWSGTVPYEIMTNINTRVPRVYSGNQDGILS